MRVAAFRLRAAAPGMGFARFDARNFFIPVREPVAMSLRAGELTPWQRDMFVG